MATKQTPAPAPRIRLRYVILLIAALLVLYVIVPQLGAFSSSLGLLGDAEWQHIALGLCGVAGMYTLSAVLYQILSKHRLRFGETLTVQVSTAFANRLLPAGIGSMGMNAAYLRKAGHTMTEAISVAAANNLTGFVAHGILLVALLTITQTELPRPAVGQWAPHAYLLLAGGSVLFMGLLASPLGTRLRRGAHSSLKHLASYRQTPRKLLAALAVSFGITGLHVFVLLMACTALDIIMSFWQLLLVLSVGVLGSVVVPVPGGLGGMEAGLVGGLMAYGLAAPDALAAALLYRLMTYWLPLLPGGIVFVAIEKRYFGQ